MGKTTHRLTVLIAAWPVLSWALTANQSEPPELRDSGQGRFHPFERPRGMTGVCAFRPKTGVDVLVSRRYGSRRWAAQLADRRHSQTGPAKRQIRDSEPRAQKGLSERECVDCVVGGDIKPVVGGDERLKMVQTAHCLRRSCERLAAIGPERVQPVVALGAHDQLRSDPSGRRLWLRSASRRGRRNCTRRSRSPARSRREFSAQSDRPPAHLADNARHRPAERQVPRRRRSKPLAT